MQVANPVMSHKSSRPKLTVVASVVPGLSQTMAKVKANSTPVDQHRSASATSSGGACRAQ